MRRLEPFEEAAGELYLSAIPGRHRTMAAESDRWARHGIELIVSLTPMEEMAIRSPEFHGAILAGRLSPEHMLYPILDFDVPGDRAGYLDLVTDLSDRLLRGQHMLVHCFGGVGRTGMTATAILVCLGVELEEARSRVQAAGAGAETAAQRELVAWISTRIDRR